jgi:hypothetical protein
MKPAPARRISGRSFLAIKAGHGLTVYSVGSSTYKTVLVDCGISDSLPKILRSKAKLDELFQCASLVDVSYAIKLSSDPSRLMISNARSASAFMLEGNINPVPRLSSGS